MLIRLGYDIRFDIAAPVPMIALLTVHPSRRHALQEPDQVRVEPAVEIEEYSDHFRQYRHAVRGAAGVDSPP